jgi:hypothetical protein
MGLKEDNGARENGRGGKRTFVKLLICLQIHRIPYGTESIESIIVRRNEFAISINIVNLGAMMFCTS